LQCFDVSTRDGISIEILEELVRISEDNDTSLKEECLFTFFINFILGKEHSHKYVKPKGEIRRPKFLRDG